MTITQSELKKSLSYDPETGDFFWLVSNRRRKKAGIIRPTGYVQIQINRKFYFLHRLAWLYSYGQMPRTDLDHINGIKDDNKIANLRECSRTENNWNSGIKRTNTSGFKGAAWHKNKDKWIAQIKVSRKTIHLGYFPSAELASEAYIAKAKELHGEFYRIPNNEK